MSNAVKFRLLMHFRWKTLFRSVASISVEFAIPFLCIFALAMIRTFKSNEVSPRYTYEPVKIEDVADLGNVRAYCPDNKINKDIMSSFPNAKSFVSRDKMERYLKNFTGDENIGVQFFQKSNNSVDKNITIGLSFGSKTTDWVIGEMFHKTIFGSDILEPFLNEGGQPYYSRHFVPLMFTLTKKVMEKAGKGSKLPNIYIQRFPYAELKQNSILKMRIHYFFLFALIIPSVYVMSFIHHEVHTMEKKVMMVRGFRSWMIWTTWLVRILAPVLIFSIISIAILFWDTRYGPIYEYSNVFLIFLLIFLSGILYFAFGCFLAVICPSVTLFQAVLMCFFVLSVVLYEVLGYYAKNYRMLCLIAIYATTNVGFDIVSRYEEKGQGVLWSNIAEANYVDKFSLGAIYLILIFEIIAFLFLAISLEALFRRKGGFSAINCKKLFKKVTPTDVPHILEEAENGEFFDDEPSELKAGIKIIGVTKDYGPNHVVRNVSMNIYEDQITVLLGHNGAGKTTLISVVNGLVTPTQGTAIINGYDIFDERSKAVDSLSICFQDDVLMDELTVHEHLVFFLVLKGTKRRSSKEEIDEILQQLDLENKAHMKVNHLSGGMKRKLSVAITLCGNSKVVMLDEPSSGLDPSARRKLWDFIEKKKKGRTIFMTTHYMDEADMLGDRIAIMCHGRIICCGSSFFLKKKYGTGYHLIIDRTPKSNARNITALIRQYIPGTEADLMTGTELFYSLPSEYSAKFPKLLRDIENESQKLGIKTFGISLTDLEEVFMKVGSSGSTKKYKPTEEFSKDATGEFATKAHGLEFFYYQSIAVLAKFVLYNRRNFLDFCGLTILAVILALLLKASKVEVVMPTMHFRLEDYDQPIVLVESNAYIQESFISSLKRSVDKIDLTKNLTERIIQMWKSSYNTMKYQYIVGTSFHSDDVYAWFNGQAYHSLPLSVQLILQHSFKSIMGDDYLLEFTSMPLLENTVDISIFVHLTSNTVLTLFILDCLTPAFILFFIRERTSGFKHLQFISGINILVFHSVSIILNILLYIILLIIPIIVIYWKKPIGIQTSEDIGILTLIFFCFCIYVIALDGFVALFINSETLGSLIIMVVVMLQVFVFLLLEAFRVLKSDSILVWILKIIFPVYACYDALGVHLRKQPCKSIIEDCMRTMEIDKKACGEYYCSLGECCFKTSGMYLDLLIMVVIGILFYLTIAAIDCRIFTTLAYRTCFKKKIPKPSGDEEDEDVLNEVNFVSRNDIEKLRSEYAIVMKDLTKYYGNFLAVNELHLTIQKAECFGLLGINGAGKTTTFKMMTGQEMMSQGDCWINGYSIKKQYNKAREYIGYCPQFSACLPSLTARETMTIMFLIRGIPDKQINESLVELAKLFDFEDHLDKKVEDMSGGNRRKLCSTLATIGNPPIIFLDEPTTGMDPATKHFFWDVIHKMRERGTSIVLTSHSMEECEALCTRLAIMVKGKFKCLGSTQHLKSRFAKGFFIMIKLLKPERINTATTGYADTSAVEQFMADTFPTAILKEKYKEFLRYEIERSDMRWSDIFEIMEEMKAQLKVEDYAVGQPRLEQIFLKFSKSTEREDQHRKKKKWCC